MERKVPFEIGEHYHLYSRGVEKRSVFMDSRDYDRFLLLLMICNGTESVKLSNLPKSQRGFPSLAGKSREMLTEIQAYSLMPNHFHILVRETTRGGISKFMLKLMTAYSMYFNTRYERSGPLFTRPFRSSHIDSDEYLKWVFAYITLNPLEIFQPDWKTCGVYDADGASRFMRNYKYSSFADYFAGARAESPIITRATAVETENFDSLIKTMFSAMPETQTGRDPDVATLI